MPVDNVDSRVHSRTVVWIRVALIVSVVVKLTLWLWILLVDPSRFVEPDSRDYLRLAHTLAEYQVFATNIDGVHVPDTNRTPGYPLLLATTFAFVGDAHAWPALVQIGLSLGTLWLVAHLGRITFCDPRIVLMAVVVSALDLPSLSFSVLLRTETLFTFLLLVAAVAGVRACRGGTHLGWAAVAGGMLAAAALVRPIAYFLPLPFAVAVGAVAATGRRFSVQLATATLVPAVLIMGGWQVRNFVVADTWVFSDTIARVASWRIVGSERVGNSSSDSLSGGADFLRTLPRRAIGLVRIHVRNAIGLMVGPGEHRLIRLLGYPGRGAPGLDLARVVGGVVSRSDPRASESPTHTLSWFVRKWFSPPRWPALVFLFAAVHLALVNVGVLLWVGSMWRARHGFGPYLLPAVIVFYFLAVSFASSRFRAPIMPFLALFAAAGLVAVIDRDFPLARGR